MEFAQDLMSALRSRTQTGGDISGGADSDLLLDWSGLHARLASAHALRRELGCSDSRQMLLDGSFSDWPLSASGGPKSIHAVNLKDSTDRKALRCMDAGNAGLVHAGGREQ